MKPKEKEIGALIEESVLVLKRKRYSDSTIFTKQRVWKNGICKYLQERRLVKFSRSIGEEFLRSQKEQVSHCSYKHHSDAIDTLVQVLESGDINKKKPQSIEYPLLGAIGQEAENFIQHQHVLKKKNVTIAKHQRVLYRFISYLASSNINNISDITEKSILEFLDNAETESTKERDSNTLSLFIKYLYDTDKMKTNFEYVLKGHASLHQNKLPSTYTKEEIVIAKEMIDVASDVGKRDLAIYLLGSRYGLRASDISNLSFSQIDWDRNLIKINQYKTKNHLELPLLKEVGEAIIIYIKYSRPIVDSDYIFVTASAPFRQVTPLAVSKIIARAFHRAGIQTHNRKSGSHALRHSLATNLLKDRCPLPVISEILGHTNCESTLNYIRVDVNGLLPFCLDVPPVDKEFYNQETFYE